MPCDPPLMALLLVCSFFQNEERGPSADRDLVHPAQPFACIGFQREGATAKQQNSPEEAVAPSLWNPHPRISKHPKNNHRENLF